MSKFIVAFFSFFLMTEVCAAVCVDRNVERYCGSSLSRTQTPEQNNQGAEDPTPEDEIDQRDLSEKSCDRSHDNTLECCNEPVSCLGGKHLNTFYTVSKVTSVVGGGAATLASTLGKDLSSVCQTLQIASASSAGLALAASRKCTNRIKLCSKNCNRQIEEECEKYKSIKQRCNTTCAAAAGGCTTAPAFFNKEAGAILSIIEDYRHNKQNCGEQKEASEKLMTDMIALMGTVIATEICKDKSREIKNEEECEDKGGDWSDDKCTLPHERCADDGGVWSEEDQECRAQDDETGSSDVIINPPDHTIPVNTQTPHNPGTSSDDGGGEGSSDPEEQGPPTPSTARPGTTSGEPGDDEPEDDDSYLVNGGTGGGGSSLSAFGRHRRPFTNSKKKKPDNSDEFGKFKASGGGFGGYNTKGRKKRRSNRNSRKKSITAKNKLKADKKTEKLAVGASGVHQNIFERISIRFKKLCRENIECD